MRAEPSTVDDDVMYIAPAPLKPQDVAELNRQMQQVNSVRKRQSRPGKVDLLRTPESV